MKKAVLIGFVFLSMLPLGFAVRAGDLPPVPLTTAKVRLAGDANSDGSVDLRDAAVITRHLAGGWNVTIDTSNADVNGDKIVDLKDVALVRRYLAGGWNVTLQ